MKDKAGIWENYSKVLPPEEAEAHEGSFQIVEGRIESAALKQNRIYLNFGKDWKTDFTISIAPGGQARLLEAESRPAAMERETGARARVDREL
jgi:micrococcal nuclease